MKDVIKTLTEIMLAHKEDEYYQQIKNNLGVVLDFVERWNKQDSDPNVANAAQFLSRLL